MEEKFKRKHWLEISWKRLSRAPKSKRAIEEEGEENGKRRKFKQEQGQSATEQMRVLQQDVPSIRLKVETSDPKLNVAREEDVVESAVDNDANAEKLVPVLEKRCFIELK